MYRVTDLVQGAWMQRARDDKAIRRKPSHAVLASAAAATTTTEEMAETEVPADRPPPVQVELTDEEQDKES